MGRTFIVFHNILCSLLWFNVVSKLMFLDLFNYQLDKRNTLVYAQNSKGFTLRGDYSITEYLKHQVRYSFNDQKLTI